jgi:hypothetical protein
MILSHQLSQRIMGIGIIAPSYHLTNLSSHQLVLANEGNYEVWVWTSIQHHNTSSTLPKHLHSMYQGQLHFILSNDITSTANFSKIHSSVPNFSKIHSSVLELLHAYGQTHKANLIGTLQDANAHKKQILPYYRMNKFVELWWYFFHFFHRQNLINA